MNCSRARAALRSFTNKKKKINFYLQPTSVNLRDNKEFLSSLNSINIHILVYNQFTFFILYFFLWMSPLLFRFSFLSTSLLPRILLPNYFLLQFFPPSLYAGFLNCLWCHPIISHFTKLNFYPSTLFKWWCLKVKFLKFRNNYLYLCYLLRLWCFYYLYYCARAS